MGLRGKGYSEVRSPVLDRGRPWTSLVKSLLLNARALLAMPEIGIGFGSGRASTTRQLPG